MIATLARWTQPDFRRKAETSGHPQLVTIPNSHYVDLARWSLQIVGRPFEEYGYAPLQHMLPVLSIRVAGKEKFISKTQYIKKVQTSSRREDKQQTTPLNADNKNAEAGGSTSVPVCVMPDGRVLLDSWDIAAESGLPGPSSDAKKLLDEELGVLTRQLAYYYLLKPANSSVWCGLCTNQKHWLWRLIWTMGIRGVLTNVLKNTFASDNLDAVRECREKLKKLFQRLDEELLIPNKIEVVEGSLNGHYVHGRQIGITGTYR